LWLENFDHVKSPKLLDSLHVKYSTLSLSGIARKLMGRHQVSDLRSQPARSSPFSKGCPFGREYETWNCKLNLQRVSV
jgi:hypothetical protein